MLNGLLGSLDHFYWWWLGIFCSPVPSSRWRDPRCRRKEGFCRRRSVRGRRSVRLLAIIASRPIGFSRRGWWRCLRWFIRLVLVFFSRSDRLSFIGVRVIICWWFRAIEVAGGAEYPSADQNRSIFSPVWWLYYSKVFSWLRVLLWYL